MPTRLRDGRELRNPCSVLRNSSCLRRRIEIHRALPASRGRLLRPLCDVVRPRRRRASTVSRRQWLAKRAGSNRAACRSPTEPAASFERLCVDRLVAAIVDVDRRIELAQTHVAESRLGDDERKILRIEHEFMVAAEVGDEIHDVDATLEFEAHRLITEFLAIESVRLEIRLEENARIGNRDANAAAGLEDAVAFFEHAEERARIREVLQYVRRVNLVDGAIGEGQWTREVVLDIGADVEIERRPAGEPRSGSDLELDRLSCRQNALGCFASARGRDAPRIPPIQLPPCPEGRLANERGKDSGETMPQRSASPCGDRSE